MDLLNKLTKENIESLKTEAVQYAERAYAAYSHFKVGAAVLAEDGLIYGGCNIENAAYPSSICAERVAIFKAVSAGNRRILALAVSTPNAGSPCGECRQVMREFASDEMPIYILDHQANLAVQMSFAELLPRSFGPQDLKTLD